VRITPDFFVLWTHAVVKHHSVTQEGDPECAAYFTGLGRRDRTLLVPGYMLYGRVCLRRSVWDWYYGSGTEQMGWLALNNT
jgi:hypothetical protein